ncbi:MULTISPECIES: hypothetical protein [Cryobacterium]|uniref:Uncharacterized protein n=2 Tax=Cryobacterium TaxID=69578 RepID=A0A4R9AVJ3_9MICO|nr:MULTISPECIES: hypothetical protein [Cryobacterium]TFD66291.1 hypothetical protein E3T47_07200 [Cryobacterium ruanii]TFD70642.1 hypothetical protein E3T50_08580 [Cryobacterium gelidum]
MALLDLVREGRRALPESWQRGRYYQYATDAQNGDVDHAAPTQSITITLSFPDRAAHGINAAALIRSMIDAGLGHFWEGDQDDVTATSTATP